MQIYAFCVNYVQIGVFDLNVVVWWITIISLCSTRTCVCLLKLKLRIIMIEWCCWCWWGGRTDESRLRDRERERAPGKSCGGAFCVPARLHPYWLICIECPRPCTLNCWFVFFVMFLCCLIRLFSKMCFSSFIHPLCVPKCLCRGLQSNPPPILIH